MVWGLAVSKKKSLFPTPMSQRARGNGPTHQGATANGKSAGPNTMQGLEEDDRACVKIHESPPSPAHHHCNLKEAAGRGEYNRKWQPSRTREMGQDTHPSALSLSLSAVSVFAWELFF